MTRVTFEALEYHADTSFAPVQLTFEGSPGGGWRVARNGRPHLELGSGYRLLRTRSCGVCSTDLARHALPFPLPQVTGHELVAEDEHGQRFVVEINASHAARGEVHGAHGCAFCSGGLATHCPERLVLGIHDLPGGFGPYVLAPVHATLAVPAAIPTATAALVEPFAAALHAVTTLFEGARALEVEEVQRVAVLGPRRLGLLVVAALAGWRERAGATFEILALVRRAELGALAREFGADAARVVAGDGCDLPRGLAEVVIDTTGHPAGLETALHVASREVHLKSTHGQAAAGWRNLTELVVDELTVGPAPARWSELVAARATHTGAPLRVAWLAGGAPPDEAVRGLRWLPGRDPGAILSALEAEASSGAPSQLARADIAVVSDAAQGQRAIRPDPRREVSLVRPRGEVLVLPGAQADGSALGVAVTRRGLRLSSSRCGDFARALSLLEGDLRLRSLGERLVTHRFASGDLEQAFEVARGPACIKALVEFEGGGPVAGSDR